MMKYIGILNWLACNTSPDIVICMIDLSKKQKTAMLGNLREVDKILRKVREKE